MLEVLLIRHGQTDWNRDRRIMGRLPIPLNRSGRRESARLARLIRPLRLEAVYTSPVLRAVQTARYIVRGRRLSLRKAPAVAEIDYGSWVGKTFDEVQGERSYQTYHRTPKRARAPGGESMREVASRAIRLIEQIRRRHRLGGRVAVVSHADVIKAILVRYLGLDLNDLLRIRIDNTSVSVLAFEGAHKRILGINCLASMSRLFARTDQLLALSNHRRR